MLSAAPQDTGTTGTTGPLQDAVASCDPDALKLAIASSGPITLSTTEGAMAVIGAARCSAGPDGSQLAMLSALVDSGLNVAATSVFGQGIIESVLFHAGEASIRLLLEAGANPNHPTTLGVSLLTTAQIFANNGAVRALTDHGAVIGTSPMEQEFLEKIQDPGRVVRELRRITRAPDVTPASIKEASRILVEEHWGEILPPRGDFQPEGPTARHSEAEPQFACSVCYIGFTNCMFGCQFVPPGWWRAACVLACNVALAVCLQICDDDPPDDPPDDPDDCEDTDDCEEQDCYDDGCDWDGSQCQCDDDDDGCSSGGRPIRPTPPARPQP